MKKFWVLCLDFGRQTDKSIIKLPKSNLDLNIFCAPVFMLNLIINMLLFSGTEMTRAANLTNKELMFTFTLWIQKLEKFWLMTMNQSKGELIFDREQAKPRGPRIAKILLQVVTFQTLRRSLTRISKVFENKTQGN